MATVEQWSRLRAAVKSVRHLAEVPEKDCWRNLDDAELWRRIVGQVAVIGRSAPWDAAQALWPQSGITWPALTALPPGTNVSEVAGRVQRYFAGARIRYAGSGDKLSAKATAVATNFIRVRALGGPRDVFRAFAAVSDDAERIRLVQSLLGQVGMKGARDLLMENGLLREGIALDDRVESILFAAGVIPTKSIDPRDYETVEAAVLEHVARPLGWDGVELDRTMYQQRDGVLAALR
jgi:hypothetical protein